MVENVEMKEDSDAESWGLDEEGNEYAMIPEQMELKKGISGMQEDKVFTTDVTKKQYKMTDVSSIGDIQTERISYVTDQLGISRELSRTLLIKNRWEIIPSVNTLLNDADYMQKELKFTLEEGEKLIAE